MYRINPGRTISALGMSMAVAIVAAAQTHAQARLTRHAPQNQDRAQTAGEGSPSIPVTSARPAAPKNGSNGVSLICTVNFASRRCRKARGPNSRQRCAMKLGTGIATGSRAAPSMTANHPRPFT